jgi:hypothetical protein
MEMNFILNKSNSIGVIASSVCLVHCMATPFVFVAKLCTNSCCESAPTWWALVDYFFLVIAFFAVYQSTRLTTNKRIAIALWISWMILCAVIANEKIKLFNLTEYAIYLPTLSLIVLHIYNRKYCQCETDQCCDNNNE